MKKIFISSILLLAFSCSSLPFMNNTSPEVDIAPERTYIDLQVKMHSAYTLFKALRAGVITQEEYDTLKKEIF